MTDPFPLFRVLRPAGVLLLGVWVAFFCSAETAGAQQRFGEGPRLRVEAAPTSIAPEDICVLHPGAVLPASEVQPRVLLKRPAYQKTANFEVDYNGFDGAEGQEAQTAFQRAVDIWAQHIDSPVTIRVEASFEELGENVLGSAGPNNLWFLIDSDQDVDCNDPAENDVCTLYGDALADAVLGENVAEQSSSVPNDAPDIIARFSSEASWYYGTGDPAANEIDFTSVVLHELGHGLGFFGSMTVEDADSTIAGEEGFWPFDIDNPDVPSIYDRFAVDEDGTFLINTDVYPNPSDELRQVLTSNDVFFEGEGAIIGNGGTAPPELYAPTMWNQGSSYSHLDEETYPAGDDNALMSPRIAFREVVQSPGSITCGMFRDMGWGMGPDCQVLLNVALIAFEVEARLEESAARVNWVLNNNAGVETVEVQQRAFGEERFRTVETVTVGSGGVCEEGNGGIRCELDVSDVEPGSYTFRLALFDGEQPDPEFSPERDLFIEPDVVALSSVYPNPLTAESQATVNVVVEDAQNVTVDAYNTLGQHVARIFDERVEQEDRIRFNVRTLPSGVYFLRIQGEDFAEVREVVVVK